MADEDDEPPPPLVRLRAISPPLLRDEAEVLTRGLHRLPAQLDDPDDAVHHATIHWDDLHQTMERRYRRAAAARRPRLARILPPPRRVVDRQPYAGLPADPGLFGRPRRLARREPLEQGQDDNANNIAGEELDENLHQFDMRVLPGDDDESTSSSSTDDEEEEGHTIEPGVLLTKKSAMASRTSSVTLPTRQPLDDEEEEATRAARLLAVPESHDDAASELAILIATEKSDFCIPSSSAGNNTSEEESEFRRIFARFLPSAASAPPETLVCAGSTAAAAANQTQDYDEQEIHRIVLLLRNYPDLAGELYRDYKDKEISPLEHLILEQAPLEVVQEIYELYPSALERCHRRNQRYPLHNACYYGAAPGVIAYIAQQYPQAVFATDSKSYLPLHLVLRDIHHPESLETISTLLDIYPESIVQPVTGNGNHRRSSLTHLLRFHFVHPLSRSPLSPLHYALRGRYSGEVLEHIFSRVPQNDTTKKFVIPEDWHGGTPNDYANHSILSVEAAQGLSALFPQLTSFSCHARHWTSGGFFQMLEHLGHNTSITELSLTMPHCFDSHHSSSAQVFTMYWCRFYQENRTIRQLTLQGYGPLLWPVQFALQNFTKLCLSHFTLTESTVLGQILAHPQAPQDITLQKIRISGSWIPVTEFPKKSTIERLTISLDCVDFEWIFGLLEQLSSHLNALQVFTLSRVMNHLLPDLNITKRVCAILKRRKKLKELSIDRGFYVDFTKVAKVLARYNKTLQKYDVYCNAQSSTAGTAMLKLLTIDNNLSLRHITCHHKDLFRTTNHCVPHIDYWTRLNYYGRKHARKANGDLALFCDLLASVDGHPFDEHNTIDIGKLNLLKVLSSKGALSVYYGLLRELPAKWCPTYQTNQPDEVTTHDNV
jgi:hypothetical protein